MLDLGRTLLQSVERSPQATAIVDGALRLTYAQWFERIARVAGGLAGLGLRRGDRMLVAMPNRWEMATLHSACQLAGAVVTPLNWRAKADEIEYCARDADVRALAFEPVSAATVAEAPSLRRLPRVAAGGAEGGTLAFEALLEAAPLAPLLNAAADDLSLLLYTSGTTGRPKGVPRRHRTERAAALAHVAQNRYALGERTLGVMPLYHTMGVRSLLAMALVDGAFVCLPRFDPAAVGLPDARWGQRVAAFVKRKAPISAEALDAHCRGSALADFKRPREYVFVREIPRSPVGKILRRNLVAGEYEVDN